MKTLEEIFEKALLDSAQYSFSFPIVSAKLIKRQLAKKGITLTEQQVGELEKRLQNISGDSINLEFDLDDDQNKTLGLAEGDNIEIDIGEEQEFAKIQQEYVAEVEKLAPEIIEVMTSPVLAGVKKNIPSILKAHQKEMKGFEKRLHKEWKKPLDLLEAFMILAFDAGAEFNHKFRKEEAEAQNHVFDALTRLHARACQIAFEVLVLLQNGFADGAHARWRSLHEVTVVASFIKTHGDEVAERYLLHDNIESYKAAELHQKYYAILEEEPIPQDEYNSIKAIRDELIDRFGTPYKNNYGWASSVLNKDNPNFSDIEKNAGFDHLRPYYKLASHNVHATPKGLMFRLGLLGNVHNLLLAGPSNFGFTDPAQGTVFSLGLITATLMTIKPTVDNMVKCNVLLKLESEITEEFFKVQKDIEYREAT
jgi:uncharacterized protein DUF5677